MRIRAPFLQIPVTPVGAGAKCLSKLEPETGGWTIFAEETEATDLRVAAKINDQNFELMVVERIDPSTGEVAVFCDPIVVPAPSP